MNSFRVCAVLAALRLCDGLIIPQLWTQRNIGMLYKFEDRNLCVLLESAARYGLASDPVRGTIDHVACGRCKRAHTRRKSAPAYEIHDIENAHS